MQCSTRAKQFRVFEGSHSRKQRAAERRTVAVADVADGGVHGAAGHLAPERLARRLQAGSVPAADDDAVAGRQMLTRQREAEPLAAACDHDAETTAAVAGLHSPNITAIKATHLDHAAHWPGSPIFACKAAAK